MKTRLVINNIIPFRGFTALTCWPFIFVRKRAAIRYGAVADRHEHIHGEQQKEMLGIGVAMAFAAFFAGFGLLSLLFVPVFFWWYLIEWLFRLVQYRNSDRAYRNIGFEREAYANEGDSGYLHGRRPFAWIGYVFKNDKT